MMQFYKINIKKNTVFQILLTLLFATQFGFGQSFVLGRGNLAGNYYKARIGFLNNDDFSLFIDSSFYGFKFNQQSLNTISLGLSVFSFD